MLKYYVENIIAYYSTRPRITFWFVFQIFTFLQPVTLKQVDILGVVVETFRVYMDLNNYRSKRGGE